VTIRRAGGDAVIWNLSAESISRGDLEALQLQRLRGVLGVTARVTLVPPGTLPRSEGGKLRRVDDRRRVYA
jgi:phenylacetate-CoA ligase